jgi:tetratricopeptide (TPR) repeat protein
MLGLTSFATAHFNSHPLTNPVNIAIVGAVLGFFIGLIAVYIKEEPEVAIICGKSKTRLFVLGACGIIAFLAFLLYLSIPPGAGYFHNLGIDQSLKGQHDLAAKSFEQALTLYETTAGVDHPYLVEPLLGLSHTRIQQGRYKEADLIGNRALKIVEQHENATPDQHSRLLSVLARNAYFQGAYDKADSLYNTAIDMLGGDSVESSSHAMLVALTGLADVYHDQGRYREAERLRKRALKIRKDSVNGP